MLLFCATNSTKTNGRVLISTLNKSDTIYLKFFFVSNFKIQLYWSIQQQRQYFCIYFLIFLCYFLKWLQKKLMTKASSIQIFLKKKNPFLFTQTYLQQYNNYEKFLIANNFVQENNFLQNDELGLSQVRVCIHKNDMLKQKYINYFILRDGLDRENINTNASKQSDQKANYHYLIFHHNANKTVLLRAPFRDKLSKNLIFMKRFYLYFLVSLTTRQTPIFNDIYIISLHAAEFRKLYDVFFSNILFLFALKYSFSYRMSKFYIYN